MRLRGATFEGLRNSVPLPVLSDSGSLSFSLVACPVTGCYYPVTPIPCPSRPSLAPAGFLGTLPGSSGLHIALSALSWDQPAALSGRWPRFRGAG